MFHAEWNCARKKKKNIIRMFLHGRRDCLVRWKNIHCGRGSQSPEISRKKNCLSHHKTGLRYELGCILYYIEVSTKLCWENSKIFSNAYISWILTPMEESNLTNLGNDKNLTFQQVEAASHTANITQWWCKDHLPHFWPKDDWPPCSPDLNPLDFSLWFILESKACSKVHLSVDEMNTSLIWSWEENPQEIACRNEWYAKMIRPSNQIQRLLYRVNDVSHHCLTIYAIVYILKYIIFLLK